MADIYEAQYSFQRAGKTYRSNGRSWIVAPSLEQALEVIPQKSGLQIHQVLLRGRDVIEYDFCLSGDTKPPLPSEVLDRIDKVALVATVEHIRNLAQTWEGDRTHVLTKHEVAATIREVLGDD